MAITKMSAPLAGIRGTVGGVTYSANGSSIYAKQWAPPVNPRTQRQSIQRGNISSLGQYWAGLTDVQRAAWAAYAALPAQALINSLGDTYYTSGWNWYCSCNTHLLRVGRAIISAAPVQPIPPIPTLATNGLHVQATGTNNNCAVGVTASATSTEAGYPASNAFDGSLSTYWRSVAGVTSCWLQWQSNTYYTIKRYRLYCGTGRLASAPRDWTLDWYNGSIWQTLHTVTGAVWQEGYWYDYYFSGTTSARIYRLNVTAVQGAAGFVSLTEAQTYQDAAGSSAIYYAANSFYAVPAYDVVLQLAMANSTGKAVEYSSFSEVLASQLPGGTASFFQSTLDAAYGSILANRQWFARVYAQTREGRRSAPSTIKAITWP